MEVLLYILEISIGIEEDVHKMRALVVGGAGFIGSHMCDALLKLGHEVVCVDNLSLGSKNNLSHLDGRNDFRFIEQDVSCNGTMDRVFEKEKIEYVFHFAANSDIQASAKMPEIEYCNTYSTTFHILCSMKKYGVKKLFFASTSAVYGDKRGLLLTEEMPGLSPVSYYGAAKLGCEALISAFSYMNDMQSLVFRFPNVVGSRLTHGVIYDFIKKLKAEPKNLEILGNGQQSKSYIYVGDLIDAIVNFADKDKPGMEIYNVGSEGNTNVTDIARMVCEEMQLNKVMFHYTGGESGWKGDVPGFSYCLNKIHASGWKANYTSDEAVRKAIQEELEWESC